MSSNSNRNTFGKNTKLCSRTEITELFTKGSVFFVFPFRILRLETTHSENLYVISAPKRNFKKAVDRNRIKRLTKEIIRLYIAPQLDKQKTYNYAFQYVGKRIPTFEELEKVSYEIQTRLTH